MYSFLTIIIFALTPLSENQNQATMPEQNEGPEIVTAKLIKKGFKNKIGKEIEGMYDFYLSINNEDVFVRLSSSKVTRDELEPFVGKTCKFRIERGDGLWDTDDPNIQSRVGPFVNVIDILGN